MNQIIQLYVYLPQPFNDTETFCGREPTGRVYQHSFKPSDTNMRRDSCDESRKRIITMVEDLSDGANWDLSLIHI